MPCIGQTGRLARLGWAVGRQRSNGGAHISGREAHGPYRAWMAGWAYSAWGEIGRV